jgi:hypothetical protein
MLDGYSVTSADWFELDRFMLSCGAGGVLAVVRERNMDVIDTRVPRMRFSEAYRVRIDPRVAGLPGAVVLVGDGAAIDSAGYFREFMVSALALMVGTVVPESGVSGAVVARGGRNRRGRAGVPVRER